MPLDPHVARFLGSLGMSSPRQVADLSVAQRRDALAGLLAFWGEPDPVDAVTECVTTGSSSGLTLRLYTPLAAPSLLLAGLVFFHGGGLVAGNLDTHDGICRALANASGCKVVSVAYRLAPEARFPAALEDGCEAARWVAANAGSLGIDPERLGLGGDSAGGTLAAAVCQQLVGREPRLAFQLLACPILDYRARTESRRLFESGYMLDQSLIEHDLASYLRDCDDPSDPRISPLRCERLAGLPPAVIHTAECDPLRDEGALYADRLQAAGVRTSYRCHPGMMHLFYALREIIPYAGEAIRQMGDDIRVLVA